MVKLHESLPDVEEGIVQLGHPLASALGFTEEEFVGGPYGSYLWWDGKHLLVSFVVARRQGVGSFSRFVDKCQELGVPIRVPTPVKAMPEILNRWGWSTDFEQHDQDPNEKVEVRDPPAEGPWRRPRRTS